MSAPICFIRAMIVASLHFLGRDLRREQRFLVVLTATGTHKPVQFTVSSRLKNLFLLP